MEESRLPRVVDATGYVLGEEEVNLEIELYKRAGVSFICPHCRALAGTNIYNEFVRRRAMIRPLGVYEVKNGRLVNPVEMKKPENSSWRKKISYVASFLSGLILWMLNAIHVRDFALNQLFSLLILVGFVAIVVKLGEVENRTVEAFVKWNR